MEELYEQFVRDVLGIYDDSILYKTCNRDEFFHVLRVLRRRQKLKVDGREAWRQQYYYRCLTVALARAFIRALEQHRNYVEAVDVFEYFPLFNFYGVFRLICETLGGSYRRGKCYTTLTANDFREFIKLRGSTKTADELLAKWKQYLSRARGLQGAVGAETKLMSKEFRAEDRGL